MIPMANKRTAPLHRPTQMRPRITLPWLAIITSLLLAWPEPAWAQNIASAGTAILGYQAAGDGSPGTLSFHVGTAANINDGDLTTRVDNWSGGSDQGQSVSFVGIRIIGQNGGNAGADANGFLGVYELEVTTMPTGQSAGQALD